MREYDQIAAWYAAVRNPDVGLADLARLARSLPPNARVLDLGCGDGVPISQALRQDGVDLVGLDSSSEMIRRYRANFPDAECRCERIQNAQFAVESFDAVVAWGVLFHLNETEQAAALSDVGRWLKPGASLLFTSGEAAGSVESEMNGVTFRYLSLGASAYRHLAERAGMHLVDPHTDDWGNEVYLATKAA